MRMSNQYIYTSGKWTVTTIRTDAGPMTGAVKEVTQPAWTGNRLYLSGKVAGYTVGFLVDTGSNVLLLPLEDLFCKMELSNKKKEKK